jgi:cation-transporting ATPase 13A1
VSVQETFEHYGKASGLGSETKVAAALERWGPNRFDVPLPAFSALLQVLLCLEPSRPRGHLP